MDYFYFHDIDSRVDFIIEDFSSRGSRSLSLLPEDFFVERKKKKKRKKKAIMTTEIREAAQRVHG